MIRKPWVWMALGVLSAQTAGLSCRGTLSSRLDSTQAYLAVSTRPATHDDWEYLPADGYESACLSSAHQAPDTAHLDFWPVRRIQLGFRVIDRASEPLNLDSVRGPSRIGDIMYTANGLLEDLPRSFLPLGDPPPKPPARFKLITAPNAATAHGYDITWHYDEQVPRHVHTGNARNIGDAQAFTRYASRADSVLNVLLLPHEPRPREPLDKPSDVVGVAVGGRYVKIAGPWLDYDYSWRHHRNLIHEVAHVYTVGHTWAQEDGCEDTPRHRPCWNIDSPPGCDSADLSNNIMDYTANASTLTPCQVGRIHAAIAREGSRPRAFVAPDWCVATGRSPIKLRDTFILQHATDLTRGITIAQGGHLEVRCRLSIPAGERITVLPGGSLTLAGGRIHNSCGRSWDGVFIADSGDSQPKLIWRAGSTVQGAGSLDDGEQQSGRPD